MPYINIGYDEAHRKYHYDSVTGVVTNRQTGKVYESRSLTGSLTMAVKGRTVPVHRMAWFLYYGEWPAGRLYHKDGDLSNNAITNLELHQDRDIDTKDQRKRAHGMPTYEEIAAYYEYHEEWGVIIRKRTGKPVESVATYANGKKIPIVRHKGRSFAAYKVVWLLVNGVWPRKKIVHLDGDKFNNRINNLEEQL